MSARLSAASAAARWTATVLGFVLMAVAGYLYFVAGLVVPGLVVYVLRLVWLGLLVLQIRHRRSPAVVLGLPFVAVGLLAIAATVGERLFGWNA